MKEKVLIIDDDEYYLKTTKEILSEADFIITEAVNGIEGLDKIYKESPDLIILDCIMPGLDGYQVIEKIRKDPLLSYKPVIMLTANDSEYDEIKGLELGIDDYIIKPYKPAILIARIKAILERKNISINVNPLTLLPGNVMIELEIEKRISSNIPYAVIYLDLSNFKSFNDAYGFIKGDSVIKATADILAQIVNENEKFENFVGHIGGDDFIIITDNTDFTTMVEKIINVFDKNILEHYSEEDVKRGYILTTNRQGKIQKFPIMTVSIAIVSTFHTKITHYGQLSKILAELKKYAKQNTKSSYVIDRREL